MVSVTILPSVIVSVLYPRISKCFYIDRNGSIDQAKVKPPEAFITVTKLNHFSGADTFTLV